MAAGDITHTFTNPKADGGDATITRPSDWNAAHSFAAYADGAACWVVPYGPPIEVNYASAALTANNQVQVCRVYIPVKITIARIVWRNTAISGNIGVAIYSSDGNTRLLTTGGVVAANLNSVAITPVTLGPGFYWIAWTGDNMTNTFGRASPTATVTCVNDTVVQQGTAANASSAGAPPTTLGTVSSFMVGCLIAKLQT